MTYTVSFRKLTAKAICSGLLLWSMVSVTAYAIDFMPVSEVRTGMEGTAKTVMEGTAISDFHVKVLGVMKDRGPSGDLILAEFSGAPIDRSGGIAHGMSGSPVYINGKLVGAVAYGWGFSRSNIGMITPIEQMVKLWDVPYTKNVPNPWAGEIGRGELIPLGTPFMAYGFDSNSLTFMKEKLQGYSIEPYDTAAGPGDDRAVPLQPGSSVAATLVDGDLKLGAIGTVTYVDNGKVVAFGHPFLQRGNTGYFMHNAYVFTVVNNINSSFKLGSIGATVGAVTEDRGAGIAGTEGITPKFIPVTVDIFDQDLGLGQKANVKIIDDETLSPSLATTVIYNYLTKTIDRKGGGTAKISYVVTPSNSKYKPFTRTNMFYSQGNISSKSMDEFYNIMERLADNTFTDYDISHIAVNVDVTEARKTARISNAMASPVVVAPGDVVNIRVELQPYREATTHRELSFTIPKDQALGNVVLEVRGGGVTPLPYLIEKQRYNLTDEIIRRLRSYKDFDDFFKKIQEIDSNNQIVAEILDTGVSLVDGEGDDVSNAAKLSDVGRDPLPGENNPDMQTGVDNKPKLDDKDKPVSRIDTEYVISGDGQFNIRVMSPGDRDKELKKLARAKKTETKETAEKDGITSKTVEDSTSSTLSDTSKDSGKVPSESID